VEGPWEAILQANIVGLYNVFEAARRNGVKRTLFATKQPRRRLLPARRGDRPSRVSAPRQPLRRLEGVREAVGSLYADKYGLEVFNIRIGNVNEQPIDKRRLAIWISPRDWRSS